MTKKAVGYCSVHGLIVGEEIEYNFPNQSNCSECGESISKTKITTEAEINAAKS